LLAISRCRLASIDANPRLLFPVPDIAPPSVGDITNSHRGSPQQHASASNILHSVLVTNAPVRRKSRAVAEYDRPNFVEQTDFVFSIDHPRCAASDPQTARIN
jgi:hypothetical protein